MEPKPVTPIESADLYFVGITATASSIMRIFPRWAERLGLGTCTIRGLDMEKPCDPAAYRAVLDHIRQDQRCRGAVVTSHKMDLYATCGDAFDELDRAALVKAGRMGKAEQELAMLAEAARIGYRGEWRFNEWLHGETGKPMGGDDQNWNAALYVLAFESVRSGHVPLLAM